MKLGRECTCRGVITYPRPLPRLKSSSSLLLILSASCSCSQFPPTVLRCGLNTCGLRSSTCPNRPPWQPTSTWIKPDARFLSPSPGNSLPLIAAATPSTHVMVRALEKAVHFLKLTAFHSAHFRPKSYHKAQRIAKTLTTVAVYGLLHLNAGSLDSTSSTVLRTGGNLKA